MKIDHHEMFCEQKSRLLTLRCCRVSDSGAKGENGDAALQRRDVRNTSGGRRQPETKGLIQAGVVTSRKLKD